MKHTIFYVLFLSITLIACKEKSQLEKDVMAVHDAVMPKMGELDRSKKKLRKILKTTQDSTQQKEIRTAILNLENASEGMLDWMDQYKIPKDQSQKETYLRSEMIRIKKVSDDMLSSLDKAKEIILSNEK